MTLHKVRSGAFGWLVLALVIVGCTDEVQPARDPISYDLLPSNTLFGTEIVFLDSLQTKARVRAGRLRWFSTQQQTMLDSSVYVEFLSSAGHCAARLWCDSAVVENATSHMWAYGHVIVISDSTRARLETASLRWDNQRRRLATNDYVRIERPGEIVEGGYGFESDEYLKHYTIFHVRGNLLP
jgi:LPS export ABC transporter protein LptC